MNAVVNVNQNTLRRRGVGLRAFDPQKSFPGFTLFAPLTGKGEVYLINLRGNVVHRWQLPYPPGLYGYLLPNSNLFYGGKDLSGAGDCERFPPWPLFKAGVVLEANWDGRILRELHHPDHHHDARALRNGNVLLLCIEKIPREQVARIRGGIPGTEAGGDIYADVLHELTWEGEMVWSWHAYQHLDPETDIITAQDHRYEWSHGNTVEELADGNILVSFRNISTVVIIDRDSGEIIWKLGHEVLAQQHHPNELANGNLLIFDNGAHRGDAALNFSRVIEVNRHTKDIVWQYIDRPPQNFFSAYISGAQRLPNGNTLITEGAYGRLFEVTPAGAVVWEYVNPYFAEPAPAEATDFLARGEQNAVFRAFRYGPECFPRLAADR